jgi:glutamate-ammonia-ligase adenylyltransferase
MAQGAAFQLPLLAPAPELAALLPPALSPPLRNAAAWAWAQAPFLKSLIRARRATMADLAALGPDAALAGIMARAADAAQPIMPRLRLARRDLALVTALADLAGLWPLERVTAALSAFHDLAIHAAIAEACAERDAPPIGMVALALGKLGSGELNYSSDADLIIIHDPDTLPCRPGEEPDTAAVRLARRAVAILADITPDGQVCRVDLRLRPAPEVTPISLGVAAAEHYYQSSAESWERFAFIRARPAGGDMALGQGFLAAIRPFVWRRAMDFTAVRDIEAMSLSIRDHFEGGQALGPNFDLKRGRGGIREVEFYAQIHQLIWGGRDASLRAPATMDALAALAGAGRIDAGAAAQLAGNYRFLRMLEHRLQMRHDAQTHAIPRLKADRDAVARLAGWADGAALLAALAPVTAGVAAAYDQLIAAAAPAPAQVPADSGAWLKTHHPALARALPPLIASWRAGSLRSLKSEAARAQFETVLPALLAGLAEAADPPAAARRLDALLASLPPGAQFFALLAANPRLIGLLTRLLGVAPVLADALARAPALFDVMLAPDAFAPLPDAAGLAAELAGWCAGQPLEQVLDHVRRWTGERRFQIGAQLVEGHCPPARAARQLSDLADAALAGLLPAVAADFAVAHGQVPGGRLLVLALGRYGGQALTLASDLDLVLLFTGSQDAMSDGAKPLTATVYFNRLAARLISALSVPTAAGALYEVDTRLRPWGAKGLLAVSVESFLKYQAAEAESWEHMALTRARQPFAADAGLAQGIMAVLARPRDRATLLAEARAMRADMAAAKPAQGEHDVKLGAGGLVDLEFIVHVTQLLTGQGLAPQLDAAIAALVAAGALPAGLAAAQAQLNGWLVLLRLLAPGGRVPESFSPAVAAMLARGLGAKDFAAARDNLAQARNTVRLAWDALF